MLKLIPGIALLIMLMTASTVEAEDEEREIGWFNTTEFSLATTDGNAESTSLALRNSLRRVWNKSEFELKASALRTETATISRRAIGTPESFVVETTSESQLTAEKYDLHGRFKQDLSERMFWFAGAGWERNEFAGIANRSTIFGGIGNTWLDEEGHSFETDYSMTYTDQEDVVQGPGADKQFLGVRFSWDYAIELTSTTEYANTLALDGNFEDASDYRADMLNSLGVSINDRLALKVSLQLQYANQPALGEIPLENPAAPGASGTVLAPLEKLDTILTTSLVVDF
jgi:putative salt-induced outer membrane protein YdiY